MPAIECTPWCEHGDGHTDAGHPDDQYCSALYEVLELGHTDPVSWGGIWSKLDAVTYVLKDRYAEPVVRLAIEPGISVRLSAAEARVLAERLTACADLVEPV